VTALTRHQRDLLERLVSSLRSRLTQDLHFVAAGKYGIDRDGQIAGEQDLLLDGPDLTARRELVAIVQHLREDGENARDAVTRLLREATFTQLNRLVAVRVAEAIGILPESLARGRASQGFVNLRELAPLLADDATGGYATYLRMCADDLAADTPELFDPRSPLLALAPTPPALEDVIALLSAAAATDVWGCDDTLGWVYQFFNRKEERDAMRAASAAPRTSLELAVRNQFFTPGYVVDYLVQNTLGRHLVAHDPSGELVARLPFLVDPPAYAGAPCDLRAIKVLDPAVGSAHMLLGAYDVLEMAWAIAGVGPADAASHIVASLWGIDIDPRAAQVAAAAITLRARRQAGARPLSRPNVVTARGLPALTPELLGQLHLPPAQEQELRAIGAALADAAELGSLLQAEVALQDQARRAGLPAAAVGAQLGLSVQHDEDRVAADEHAILDAVRRVGDAATSTPAERLFAADAGDALRFVEAMRIRYDAVLMNPPFGEPIPSTKAYLRAAYPWSPARIDLLALFVGRGLELCTPTGYLGAITNRAALYTSTFAGWRERIVLGHELITMADLGYRVMSQAKVEAAAYVIAKRPRSPAAQATFLRILRDSDKGAALAETTRHARAGEPDGRVFRLPLATFDALPGSVIAYAASPIVLRLFADLPRVGAGAEVVVGLQTSDDARFVRAFWEVDPARIARTAEETERGGRWVPFAKGGEYAPYWSDIHLVVDYEERGRRLREFDRAYIRNPSFYFRTGVTWPARTNSALSVRVLPAGCAFGHKGPSLFAADPLPYLAWLNSRFARLLIDVTAAGADEDKTDVSRSYEVGTIRDLPDPTHIDTATTGALRELVTSAVRLLATADEDDETTRRFVAPAALVGSGGSLATRASAAHRRNLVRSLDVLDAHDEIDQVLSRALDPDGDATPALVDADGPLVTELPETSVAPDLLLAPLSHVVDAATERHGVARWIGLQHQTVDRVLELTAVATGVSPRALINALDPAALPHGEPERSANEVLSYLVGVAFGRWDVRIAADHDQAPARPAPEAPVPLSPPGMLVDHSGRPAGAAPSGYPVALPADRLLVDEPGHAWDLLTRVQASADSAVDDPTALLDDIAIALGSDLRAYLRRRFFRTHRTRYSKSRRVAPLYWPLTVPSREWGVWVYPPALSREMLYAIVAAAAERGARAESEIVRLQQERGAGGAGRSPQALMTALAAAQELAEQLKDFHTEAERVAASGWTPDPDDGFLLNAAPLADLFPDWAELAGTRAEIRAGMVPWSSVHRWRGAL